MKRQISVLRDDTKPDQISIASPDGQGIPWDDLGLLLEGVGILTNVCINSGKTEHNGKPIKDYLKDYIDSACDGCERVLTIIK